MGSRCWIEERNYRSDHRVRAGADRWFVSLHGTFAKVDLTRFVEIPEEIEDLVPLLDFADEDGLVTVPVRMDVCPTCNGTGCHTNPSIDASGLTSEDFHEDPDFAEDYTAGVFDVTCYGCDGRNVVPVNAHPGLQRVMDEVAEDLAQSRMIEEAERRMGC